MVKALLIEQMVAFDFKYSFKIFTLIYLHMEMRDDNYEIYKKKSGFFGY